MLAAGQNLTLKIEKPAAGGRMIARLNGQVILVSGAIPGETVTEMRLRVTEAMTRSAQDLLDDLRRVGRAQGMAERGPPRGGRGHVEPVAVEAGPRYLGFPRGEALAGLSPIARS